MLNSDTKNKKIHRYGELIVLIWKELEHGFAPCLLGRNCRVAYYSFLMTRECDIRARRASGRKYANGGLAMAAVVRRFYSLMS